MSDQNFIYQNPKKNPSPSKEQSDTYYTLVGMHDFIDSESNYVVDSNNKNIFAKQIHDSNGSKKFYVRLANNGSIYNPISIYGEEKTNTFLDRVCKDGIKFREVNQKVFNMYLKFLGSKNIAWLHSAEREVI